jgi:glycosyltransferase involved in cell wall biosynthesis
MKIAMVVPGFASSLDDPCIPVLRDMANALGRYAEVHVFALRYPPVARRYTLDAVQVHSLGAGDRGGVRRLPLLWSAVRAIRDEHARSPFDALHGVWADEPGAVAVAAARAIARPSVVSLMGGELVALGDIAYGGARSRANRHLYAWALRHATHVTAGSLAGTTALAKHGRTARCIPWGIDPSVFAQGGPSAVLQGEIRILHVGSLVPVKDHMLLFAALREARRGPDDVHLHLVGDGPLRDSLQRGAESLGIRDAVTFHGHVPRRQLGPYYRACDVLAVTSRHEMQPVVVLEAAACGLRSAGVAVGLLPDLSPDLTVVAPDRDPTRIARSLLSTAARSIRRERRHPITPPSLLPNAYTAGATAAHFLALYSHSSRSADHAVLQVVTPSVCTDNSAALDSASSRKR